MKGMEDTDLNGLIVEQMADAMIYSDKHGVIRGWNAAAESLFGFVKAEAIGQSLDLIIPERLREAHWVGFNRAMASGTTRLAGHATITRSLTRDKGTIYVEMSFAVVGDGRGNPIGSSQSFAMRHSAVRVNENSASVSKLWRSFIPERHRGCVGGSHLGRPRILTSRLSDGLLR